MEDEPITAEATDPEGRRVVLADAVWREKIVRDHPEIDTHMSDVLQAVSKPDHVAADPIFAAFFSLFYVDQLDRGFSL